MVRAGSLPVNKADSKVNGGGVVGINFQENPTETSNEFGLVMVHKMASSVPLSTQG